MDSSSSHSPPPPLSVSARKVDGVCPGGGRSLPPPPPGQPWTAIMYTYFLLLSFLQSNDALPSAMDSSSTPAPYIPHCVRAKESRRGRAERGRGRGGIPCQGGGMYMHARPGVHSAASETAISRPRASNGLPLPSLRRAFQITLTLSNPSRLAAAPLPRWVLQRPLLPSQGRCEDGGLKA